MTRPTQKLDSLAGTSIVLGPMLIAIGSILLFSSPPVLPVIGVVALGLGVPVLAGGIVARAISYALFATQHRLGDGVAE